MCLMGDFGKSEGVQVPAYRIGLTDNHVIDDETGHHYRLKLNSVVVSYSARNPQRRFTNKTMYRTLKWDGKRAKEIRAFIVAHKKEVRDEG